MAKPESFSSLREKLSKKYDTQLGAMSSIAKNVEAISSGNIAIDHVLGVGGFPKGRCIELYGPPSCGKSTTALQAAASYQRAIKAGEPGYEGKSILYMDHENAMDPDYARALGLNVDDEETFIFAQPDSLEQSANISRELVQSGYVGMAIYDSVAAMTPLKALEAETGKASVAMQARLMSDFLKAYVAMLNDTQTTALFLNHIAEVIDMGGRGRPGVKRYTTPGGRALKFYASVRVEYQQSKNIVQEVTDELTQETQKQVRASDVRVRVVKNKVAAPFRQCTVRVRYGQGFDNGFTALQILTGHKKIIKGGSGYYYFNRVPEFAPDWMARQPSGNKRPYIQAEHNVYAAMDEHPEWREGLINFASQVAAESNGVAGVVEDADGESDEEEDIDPASEQDSA